jgi:hypothetical protein
MALFAPYVNSYRRLARFTAAPINIQWGTDNRTVGIRSPVASPAARRIENRVIGADANPYVALAATLACGWLGMQNRIEPTPECKGDAYLGDYALPRSLGQALDLLRNEADLAAVLGSEFITVYTEVKEIEQDEFMKVISPWEREATCCCTSDRPTQTGCLRMTRSTQAWQAGRRGPLPAPLHRLPVAGEEGLAHHRQGREHLAHRQRGPAPARRDVRPVVRQRRLRPEALVEAATRQMRELPFYNAFFQTATPPAIELAEKLAEVTPPQFQHVFFSRQRQRGQRHRRAHGAPLLGPARPAAAQRDHQPRQRLPRQHDGRRLAGRHGLGHARPGRAADPRHRAHPAAATGTEHGRAMSKDDVRPRRRALAGRQDPGGRPGQGGRLHRRAGAGRRRRHRAA